MLDVGAPYNIQIQPQLPTSTACSETTTPTNQTTNQPTKQPTPNHSLTPLNMPDYAEVAGCSTFKNTTSPLYDSYGAYATTNLVRDANVFANNFPNNNKNGMYPSPSKKAVSSSMTSAASSATASPTSFHYIANNNGKGHKNNGDGHTFAHSDSNFPAPNMTTASKMNIIENKMDIINNLNRSTAPIGMSASVPATPIIGIGTMRRNRLPKVGHCDKISFGGCDSGRSMDQPLFVKSKEDGTWASVQNSSYHFPATSAMSVNHADSLRKKMNGSIKSNGGGCPKGGSVGGASGNNIANNSHSTSSQIYLSSFGKYDNV